MRRLIAALLMGVLALQPVMAQKVSTFPPLSVPYQAGDEFYAIQGGKPYSATFGALQQQLGILATAIVFTPEQYGAVGNGIKDDTSAISSMCSAANLVGGAIWFSRGKTYLINQGVSFSDGTNHFLCTLTNGSLTVQGQGATIIDGATYSNSPTTFIMFSVMGGSGYEIHNIKYTTQNPLTLPQATPLGPIILSVFGTTAQQILMTNSQMFGGQAVADIDGGSLATILNAYSQDSVYGVVTPDGGGSNGFFQVSCLHVERCGFTYGGVNGAYSKQKWQVVDKNSLDNTFLIECAAQGTGNLDIDYQALPRTIGTYANSYLTFDQKFTNGICDNIRVHVDIDGSGDNNASAGPAIKSDKFTTGTLSSITRNIQISGTIRNWGASAPTPVNWNVAASAPWSSETQSGIDFNGLQILGSSGSFHADMAPFSASAPGMTFRQFAASARAFDNDNILKRSDGESVFINGAPVGNGQVTGSWTPTDGSGASLTFTAVTANYTKIGNLVSAYFSVTYPSTASGSTAIIAGLPLPVPNTTYAQGPAACSSTMGVATLLLFPALNTSTAIFKLDTGANVTNANLSSAQVFCNLVYPAS
jgi:hypothetical protein